MTARGAESHLRATTATSVATGSAPLPDTGAATRADFTVVPVFAATVLVNAFLLFLLQPMFGKMALPHLGGSSAVWTTCMLFFETALLAGYVYAHLLASRFPTRAQVWIHSMLLAAALVSLPLGIPAGWAPPDPARPVTAFLALLTLRVGAPFVLLAAGSPLLQHWFANTPGVQHRNPYALYVASNLGSAAGLLVYPIVLEPRTTLTAQSELWLAGYLVLGMLAIWCGLLARSTPRVAAPAASASAPPIGWRDRALWTALAAVPSSLLLGVTTHITTDLAPIPLLWIIPLALYLFTFVIAFGTERRWIPIVARRTLPFLAIAVIELLFLRSELRGRAGYALHLLTFFICALACHLQLAGRRPTPSRLTEFYVWIAAGGALGGVVNVIVAPAVFHDVLEYPLAIVGAVALYRPAERGRRSLDIALPMGLAVTLVAIVTLAGHTMPPGMALSASLVGVSAVTTFAFRDRPIRFALGLFAIVLAAMPMNRTDGRQQLAARSFYGVYRVVDDSAAGLRRFYSGTTIHGAEFLADTGGRQPLTYYHPEGPLGSLFAARAWRPAPWRVALIGLGAGATAAYARPGESWTLYEIDPLVATIASDSRYFHFLSGAVASPRIVLGDARLSLARAPQRSFDVLLVDAFSSDAIPVHLLTREALALYRSRLAVDGVIGWHISNKYVDLRPVLAALAEDAGLTSLIYEDLRVPANAGGRLPSIWVVMTASQTAAEAIERDPRWKPLAVARLPRPWTDDFSNILRVLR